MGHIAHLRKQLKSINTYDYIITLIKRRKKPSFTLWEFNCSSFEQTWIPFIQGCILPSLVEISLAVLVEKIFKFVNVFSLFHYYLYWKRTGPFILTNLNPLHQRVHCAKFGWNWPSGSWENLKIGKVYRRTDWQMDRMTYHRRQAIRKYFSSGELKY